MGGRVGGPSETGLSQVYLDTHAAVFLQAGEIELLGNEGKRQIELCDLLISPMVFLEFEYLYASKAIRYGARQMFADLNTSFGVTLCTLPFPAVAHEALSIDWTRDPFDRMIVAQAQLNHGAALITRDRLIRRNYVRSIW